MNGRVREKQKPGFYKLTILLLLLHSLAACGLNQRGTGPAEAPISLLSIECQVFYRASVTVGIEREEILILDRNNADQSVVFDDLAFHAAFSTGESPPHERGLRVWVTAADSEEELVRQLYQMSLSDPPRNQFVGEHGFTGLNYVYHPTSRAEMQYLCLAR